MWKEDELMAQLEHYLANTSKEQMIQDLIDADCMKFIENADDTSKE